MNYSNNKEVVMLATNFNKINNMAFKKDDVISIKLVKIYEEYIFSLNAKDNKEKIKNIDKVIYRYLIDFDFKKEVNTMFSNIIIKEKEESLTEKVINSLLEIYDKYLEEYTRRIYIPKWI